MNPSAPPNNAAPEIEARGQARAETLRAPELFSLKEDAGNHVKINIAARSTSLEDVADETIVPSKKRKQGIRWGKIFAGSLSSLAMLFVTLQIEAFITNLLYTNTLVGLFALALATLALLALFIMLWREFFAIRRLHRIEGFRATATEIETSDARAPALKLAEQLIQHHKKSFPEREAPRTQLTSALSETMDGRDILRTAEKILLFPQDNAAEAAISRAAKRVSLVTAISPRAILDVLFVGVQATRLVREIAEIYGGRPGSFGMWRLLKSVATHLAITGGMAAGEGILSQLTGAGVAARISAKFGEGMLNGLLTARVGLAAMSVCRPLPYLASAPPTLFKVAQTVISPAEKAENSTNA